MFCGAFRAKAMEVTGASPELRVDSDMGTGVEELDFP